MDTIDVVWVITCVTGMFMLGDFLGWRMYHTALGDNAQDRPMLTIAGITAAYEAIRGIVKGRQGEWDVPYEEYLRRFEKEKTRRYYERLRTPTHRVGLVQNVGGNLICHDNTLYFQDSGEIRWNTSNTFEITDVSW